MGKATMKGKGNLSEKRIILLEGLPPHALSPNARVSWYEKAKAVKDYRAYVMWTCIDRKNTNDWEMWDKAILFLRFLFKGKQRRDYDNYDASAKALRDGLVDAGLIPDDDSEHLALGGGEIVKGAEKEGVEVTLLRAMPTQSIKVRNEVLTFVFESCGDLNDCEKCVFKDRCARIFDRSFD